MRLLELTIGTRHFYLPEETDLEAFERAIEHAARTGGGMIEIPGANRHPVSALITPGMPVFLEQVNPSDDIHEEHNDLASPVDLDLHGSLSDWNA